MNKITVGKNKHNLSNCPNESFYFKFTVTEDFLFPAKWIKNEKGNSVRKDVELKSGEYTSKEIYCFYTHCDSHYVGSVTVDGFTFYITDFLEFDEIKIEHVSFRRKKAPSFY